MKKALIYGLSAALLLSLTACGTSQADQSTEPVPTPSAEQNQPVETGNPLPNAEPLSVTDEDDSSLGAIDIELEKVNLTDDQLELYFESVYEICQLSSDETTLEGQIKEEISMLEYFFEVDDTVIPPDDYADKYRAWRPVDSTQGAQPSQGSTQVNTTQSGTTVQQNDTTGQQSDSSTNSTTTESNSDASLYYNGFATYEEYINDLHNQFPDYTIEQIKEAFPDLAGIHVNEAGSAADKAADRLNGHN